jgi:hypothetical protein
MKVMRADIPFRLGTNLIHNGTKDPTVALLKHWAVWIRDIEIEAVS